ncbi:NifB/NifX family molybdenum-iron cluster-binding protein [Acidaminobacterium chupaoyuni]
MKIAVTTQENNVSGHFGHCENFRLFEIENNAVVSEENLANPGHTCGALPRFLKEQGVSVVISGGMGSGAMQHCKEQGLEIIVGAQGDIRQAVDAYLNGTLKTTHAVCSGHHHEGGCGDHHHEGGCGDHHHEGGCGGHHHGRENK